MPRYSALILSFVLFASVHAIPLDELVARDGVASTGVGGQADGGSVGTQAASCSGSSADCAMSRLSGDSLLKVASENAGNGGDASSGAADGHSLLHFVDSPNSKNSIGEAPQSSGSSGAGGEAEGGSITDNQPALIELDSDNAGQGGHASSGNSSGLFDQDGDDEQKGYKALTS